MRQHSIEEIINFLLKEMANHPGALANEKGLRIWLANQGLNKREIDVALKAVAPEDNAVEEQPAPAAAWCARPLAEMETTKLTREARDALARLDRYELIDAQERESILERLNQFEGEVGMQELDYLVTWLVCSSRDHETQQLIYAALVGAPPDLH